MAFSGKASPVVRAREMAFPVSSLDMITLRYQFVLPLGKLVPRLARHVKEKH
jgi:hypothetical protein